jgi:hypothetical protein
LQLRRIVNPSSEYLVDEPFAFKNWPIYNNPANGGALEGKKHRLNVSKTPKLLPRK